MPQILLPQRFLSQPQYPAQLDSSHPLFGDMVLAYSAGRGLHDGKHGFGSTVGAMLQGAGQKGRYIQTGDASSYAQFASLDDYNTLGEVTVVARIRTGTTGTQQTVVIKTESGGGSNTPFGLLIESDGSIAFNRATSSGGAAFRVWASAAKLAANTDYVIAASQISDISAAPSFYINGIFDAGVPSSLYSGNGLGAPGATTQSVKLGNRTDLASRFLGQIYDTLVFRRRLASTEVASLSSNIWSIWKAPERRIWTGSTGGTGSNLAVSNAAQDNTASTGAVAQVHSLASQPPAQANTASTGAISKGGEIAVQSLSQGNTAGTGTVSQVHLLSGGIAAQGNIADTIAIVVFSTALTPQQSAWLKGIALLHGLVSGSPLSVSATARSAGEVTQSISEAGGTVTVTTTAAPGGSSGTSQLSVEETQWLEELARVYGLVDPLTVTDTSRGDGTLTQTISTAGGTTTVSK